MDADVIVITYLICRNKIRFLSMSVMASNEKNYSTDFLQTWRTYLRQSNLKQRLYIYIHTYIQLCISQLKWGSSKRTVHEEIQTTNIKMQGKEKYPEGLMGGCPKSKTVIYK